MSGNALAGAMVAVALLGLSRSAAVVVRSAVSSPGASRPIRAHGPRSRRGKRGGGSAAEFPPPDARRGLSALHQHACHACHVIPGITGSVVHMGPPPAGIASRKLIAGVLPNNPEEMVRWLRDPKSVDPLTAMPDLGVSHPAARDMSAYLATLH